MHERILMYGSCLALGHLLKPAIRDVIRKNIHYQFSFPGVREWWEQDDREAITRDTEKEIEQIAFGGE